MDKNSRSEKNKNSQTHTFDFLSEFQIVQTKIIAKNRERIKLHLETLQDVLIFSIILYESRSSVMSPSFANFTVYNSSGTYNLSNTIEYYQGHVSNVNTTSRVYGTLYHDLTFEGVIDLSYKVLYLEAVDRHKPWSKDQSVLYDKDDVASFSKGMTNFPDMHDDEIQMPSLTNIYRKYGIRESPVRKVRQSQDEAAEVRYCRLHLIVDGYFVHYMANDNKLETAKLLAQYVQNVHEIFVEQDFDGNQLPDNVGVVLSGITFIDKIFGFNYLKNEKPPEKFLQLFTDNYQFPDVCAAMVFTFQDFGPTLGMAWVAQSSRPPRTGIGSPKNHGFITTLLKGRRVPSRVAQLTLAHELGHSFGSSHDPYETGHTCAPSDVQGGHYIMFPTTSEGSMPNNYEFSPCSKNVIAVIIATRGTKVLHFYDGPYCGNGFAEEGEECDCGTPLSCTLLDKCCVPAGHENQCMLERTQNALCSPAVHSCCSTDCGVLSADEQKVCSEFNECLEIAYCDGESFVCPKAIAKPDGMLCKSGTKMCEAGKCSRSVCAVAGLADCLCSLATDACKLCCTNNSDVAPRCKPVTEYSWFTERNFEVAEWLQPGSLCSDQTGYCDTDKQCVKPGFDHIGLEIPSLTRNVNDWFDRNWYTLMIAVFILVVLFVIFICSQDVPDTNISSAFRVGHIARVIQECQRQQRLLNEEITRLNSDVRLYERGQQSLPIALSRLMLLFPFTPIDSLYKVMVNSANEEGAVKKLILLRHPLRRDCTTYKDIKSKMKWPKTPGITNEQFRGQLMATVKDLTELTAKQRVGLGITDPTSGQAKKLVKDYEKKLTKGVVRVFNKPL